MDSLIFLVQGSAQEPYSVPFEWLAPKLSARCTCAAGQKRQFCKHRASLLSGAHDGVISPNRNHVARLTEWLAESDVKAALTDLAIAESAFEDAKRRISTAKRRLSDALK